MTLRERVRCRGRPLCGSAAEPSELTGELVGDAERAEEWRRHWRRHGFGLWLFSDLAGKPLGSCGLRQRRRPAAATAEAELVLWTRGAQRRREAATGMAGAVLEAAREWLPLDRITARTNEPSFAALLAELGFRPSPGAGAGRVALDLGRQTPLDPPLPRRVAEIDWRRWSARDPATLVFVIDGDRVLLIRKKRGLGAGKINGPGGRLERGETPFETAVRETEEELRIRPTDLVYAGDNRFQFLDGYSIHVHAYLAHGYRGQPEETEEALPLWTALDAIPYEEMWEDDRLWLPLALRGTRFSGRYLFDGERMLDHEILTWEGTVDSTDPAP